jgi:peroxiredoxin
LDLPKYESLDTQVLGVSTDVIGALQAFAEKLSLTYPLLSDFSRETVKQYGMMVDDPNSASFRLAQRAYVVIDQRGIIRYQQIMEDPDHALDSEEIFTTVRKIVTGTP